MKLGFSQQFFEKYSDTKFCENLSNEGRVVPCGRTDRQTDMTMVIVAFRSFANPTLIKRNLISLEDNIKWSKYINFFTYIYIYIYICVCVCVCVFVCVFSFSTRNT